MNYPDPGESPQPYQPYVVPQAAVPSKPRPGRTGVWVGIGLLIAAVVVPIVLVVTLIVPAFGGDRDEFSADGARHSLSLPAGEKYALFVPSSGDGFLHDVPSCVVAATGGRPITVRRPSGEVSLNGWRVFGTFDTGSGKVDVTCTARSSDTTLRVGKYPEIGKAVGGIFGAIGAAGVLGVAGIVLIIVTVVRRSRR
ncbi:hypothetical protein [Tsukamurella pseudospumae]|uniref:Uncharacterized protein n=1 Tax=Tsukamurella pseudospumae TaxID=239498 RepID=A0A137ZYZ6_9ACTN|nr:hypothetical protein [Tsukamurella pseudospumae]KXP03416.1 hypothetical protein AXK60_16445 [Tsukamurella pseudospumae]